MTHNNASTGRFRKIRQLAHDKGERGERNSATRPTGRTKPAPAKVSHLSTGKNSQPSASGLPVFIRAVGVPIEDSDRAYLRRKLDRKLGKFSRAVERASVRIEDINADRGGVDKLCRVKVVLRGLPSVVVDERHHSLQAAMDRSLSRTENAVRRSVQKRRPNFAPRKGGQVTQADATQGG